MISHHSLLQFLTCTSIIYNHNLLKPAWVLHLHLLRMKSSRDICISYTLLHFEPHLYPKARVFAVLDRWFSHSKDATNASGSTACSWSEGQAAGPLIIGTVIIFSDACIKIMGSDNSLESLKIEWPEYPRYKLSVSTEENTFISNLKSCFLIWVCKISD